MSEELAPCPFCGCAAEVSVHPNTVFVTCTNCWAVEGRRFNRDQEAEAIRAWNTRPTAPDNVVEVVARAIYDQSCLNIGCNPDDWSWEKVEEPFRSQHRVTAQAAIAALSASHIRPVVVHETAVDDTQAGLCSTDDHQTERKAIVAWAHRQAGMHHRIAAENEHLRKEHIALSSAYVSLASAIEAGEHLKEQS